IVGEAAGNQPATEVLSRGNADLLSVERCPASAYRLKAFVQHGIVDYAQQRLSIQPAHGDADGEMRHVMRKVRRAIQRIDVPAVRGKIKRAAVTATLLANNMMVRKSLG